MVAWWPSEVFRRILAVRPEWAVVDTFKNSIHFPSSRNKGKVADFLFVVSDN